MRRVALPTWSRLEVYLRCVEACFAKTHGCTQTSTSSTHNNGIICVVYDSVSALCRIQPLTHSSDRACASITAEQAPSSSRC